MRRPVHGVAAGKVCLQEPGKRYPVSTPTSKPGALLSSATLQLQVGRTRQDSEGHASQGNAMGRKTTCRASTLPQPPLNSSFPPASIFKMRPPRSRALRGILHLEADKTEKTELLLLWVLGIVSPLCVCGNSLLPDPSFVNIFWPAACLLLRILH